MPTSPRTKAFTLIEISIVLVILGLITGGILTGQTLIAAARMRAQISQIQKYQQSTNTFKGKYGYLPGDIPAQEANVFGFKARGLYAGEGDGNSALEGIFADGPGLNRMCFEAGELAMFWVDLTTAKLMDGSFTYANSASGFTASAITGSSTPSISTFMPEAKLGQNNYVYVYSFIDSSIGWHSVGYNYFGLSAVRQLESNGSINSAPNLTLTASNAHAIDSKLDDGQPQNGNVIAAFVGTNTIYWASGTASTGVYGASDTSATPASATTCFDNNNIAGATQLYSIKTNNGSGPNCALSFKFQ